MMVRRSAATVTTALAVVGVLAVVLCAQMEGAAAQGMVTCFRDGEFKYTLAHFKAVKERLRFHGIFEKSVLMPTLDWNGLKVLIEQEIKSDYEKTAEKLRLEGKYPGSETHPDITRQDFKDMVQQRVEEDWKTQQMVDRADFGYDMKNHNRVGTEKTAPSNETSAPQGAKHEKVLAAKLCCKGFPPDKMRLVVLAKVPEYTTDNGTKTKVRAFYNSTGSFDPLLKGVFEPFQGIVHASWVPGNIWFFKNTKNAGSRTLRLMFGDEVARRLSRFELTMPLARANMGVSARLGGGSYWQSREGSHVLSHLHILTIPRIDIPDDVPSEPATMKEINRMIGTNNFFGEDLSKMADAEGYDIPDVDTVLS